MNDKYRMMGIVPYNISPIQQGIQFGHAVVEYMLEHGDEIDCDQWAKLSKTFIILNGGTTNDGSQNDSTYIGTMNNHSLSLVDMGVNFAEFHEPDLGDQLTAVVFIVPEQVYNYKDFPNFCDWEPAIKAFRDFGTPIRLVEFKHNAISLDDFSYAEKNIYDEWLYLMGGERNVKLRNFVKQFRLA